LPLSRGHHSPFGNEVLNLLVKEMTERLRGFQGYLNPGHLVAGVFKGETADKAYFRNTARCKKSGREK
jgi:hypothetical protein